MSRDSSSPYLETRGLPMHHKGRYPALENPRNQRYGGSEMERVQEGQQPVSEPSPSTAAAELEARVGAIIETIRSVAGDPAEPTRMEAVRCERRERARNHD